MTTSSSDRLSSNHRKGLGAFYTPEALTRFAADWAINDAAASVMDPGCGDAAFLLAAHRRRSSLRSKAKPGKIIGVDLNDDATETALQLLSDAGSQNHELFSGDFFSFGADHGRALPVVDAILGNPPYIRYQLFKEENRQQGLRAAARAGVILPKLSSSWAPYVVHATSFLKDGGHMALVLPGELLHVGYAAAVREFLLRTFTNLTIVTFEDKVFLGHLKRLSSSWASKPPEIARLALSGSTHSTISTTARNAS